MPTLAVFDFTVGAHRGTIALPGGGLAAQAPEAEWISPAYTAIAPFNWAVPSWNGNGGPLEVAVRVDCGEGWSPWFTFGPWSLDGERHSVPNQRIENLGRVSTDTLLLDRYARACQLRVTLRGGALKRLWLATALREHRAPDSAFPAAHGVDLEVPRLSQMVYPDGGRVWCSPTSLAMVMAYWGHVESIPDQVVPGVYDSVYDGHGNWPFNTAYAGTRGFVAYVDHLPSLGHLEEWIHRGFPVIASVAYKKEWLPNAPIDLTGGHLLVVRGFTAEGDVIVNDPAAATDQEVRLVYKRALFQRAWLDRGGVVYLLVPEGR